MLRLRYCTNGHRVSIADLASPVFLFNADEVTPESIGVSHDFCQQCGAEVLRICGKCSAFIEVTSSSVFVRPGYCGGCGTSFPWTEAALSAAINLTNEMAELEDNEKSLLRTSLPDLLILTPNTELAVFRFRKLIAKVSPFARDAMVKIVSEVAAAGVKKQLGL